jgi:hypothetical protein
MNDLDMMIAGMDGLDLTLQEMVKQQKKTNELLEKLIEVQAIDVATKQTTGSLFENLFGPGIRNAVEQEMPEPGQEKEPLDRASFLDWRENEKGDGFDVTHDGENWTEADPVQTRDIKDMINSRPKGRGRRIR